jgi:asparagine synthase (glutamine-hydrolysing)
MVWHQVYVENVYSFQRDYALQKEFQSVKH